MIGFIVAGIVIGILARLIVPGRQRIGALMTILAGLVGSVVGGTIANALGTGDIWELNFVGFVAAVGAAVLFVAAAEGLRLGPGRKRDRRRLER
ncbi:MAG: GlsB/YeaQ/YmgE family stress response membrane protein [Thermoleophilaceae bacterium]